jgi:hypothetical protein
MGEAQRLRELAASLRSGAPTLGIAQAALETPPPAGDPEGLRTVAGGFRQRARALSDVSTDLDKLREDKLPEVWSGGIDTSAAQGRLRATARHAEHASQVLDRVMPCVNTLASYLETAQRRDTDARDRIVGALSLAETVESEYMDGVISMIAVGIDEMAEAAEFADESVVDAARDLKKYADEAGTMWLTRVRLNVPGMPAEYTNERMPPEEILLRYQQPDDPDGLVDFSRWGRTQRMTATEARMLDELNPFELYDARGIYHHSYAEQERHFPGQEDDDTDNHVDAFRHAYYNAQLSHRFGEGWAEDFTTAHEGTPFDPPTPLSEAMDLHNNQVGLRIARENPDASSGDLSDLVMQAVRDGEMVVIAEVDGQERLVYSDEVPRPDGASGGGGGGGAW